MNNTRMANRVGVVMALVLTLAWASLMVAGTPAFAEGGKNREASPILPPGDVECVYAAPTGIDLSLCTLQSAPDQSQQVFFCEALVPEEGSIIVLCE